jgi:hypothetical protein
MDSALVLRVQIQGDGATFSGDASDWHHVRYPLEESRGYDYLGSMHAPGVFQIPLPPAVTSTFQRPPSHGRTSTHSPQSMPSRLS